MVLNSRVEETPVGFNGNAALEWMISGSFCVRSVNFLFFEEKW